MNHWYLLDGKEPVPSEDLDQIMALLESPARLVASTVLPGCLRVSTCFLVRDINFGRPPRQLFETMVFKDDKAQDRYTERYATWDEAAAGHARIVAALRAQEVQP